MLINYMANVLSHIVHVKQSVAVGSPSVTLPRGTTLRSGELALHAKGVRLTKGNPLKDITDRQTLSGCAQIRATMRR